MKKIDPNMGASLVYVVVLVTFLGILSTGFLYMTEYSRRMVADNRAYIEAQATARSIHQTFCESVSGGTSEAMDTVWSCFAEDCGAVWEEYIALEEDEQTEDPGGEFEDGELMEDPGGEFEDGELMEDPGGESGEGGLTDEHLPSEAASAWEAFLRGRLEDKVYVIKGSTDLSERVSVTITLTAYPLQGKATVSTIAACNGYRFSMKGDILFDDVDGERLDLGEGVSICRKGCGVYRYYDDETTRGSSDTSPGYTRPRG